MQRQRTCNILLSGLLLPGICAAQVKKDSIVSLDEITIRAYPSNPTLLRSASSVSYLDAQHIRDLATESMVPAMNSEAGVRMEERSPGSYRLSIRGSLLRSPFGIRNIKVYLDDFPLTDAGGNTYLNLIPTSTIHSIQIIKGPEGSVFGANTGGVVVLDSENKTDSVQIMASLTTGSFGLWDEKAALYKVWNQYSLQIDQSFQIANGYRQNSALRRNSIRAIQKLRYKNGNIRLLLMGTNLHYETPGGLTLMQTQEDPRQARPATSSLPGASEQKAGIYNSTFFGGISNHLFINSHIRHEFVLYGSTTDFKNPFITNYEVRMENTFGIRTFFELHGNNHNVNWNWDVGVDWQRTGAKVENYENMAGNKGELEASDDLNAKQGFLFSQISIFTQKIRIEGAVSINRNRTEFRSNFPMHDDSFTGNSLQPVILPRVGISYRFLPQFVWRVSASKGYSPPTFAELRPSGNIINPDLEAEYGWNYETGVRFIAADNRFYADFVMFRFGLKNAIVRRSNSDETEYYVNAGSTQQNGFEFQISAELMKPNTARFINSLEIRNSFTYYDFTFDAYEHNQVVYTGNDITGIPSIVNTSSLKAGFKKETSLFLSVNHTGEIPLNDENTVYSPPYLLIGLKLSKIFGIKPHFNAMATAGIDNILNTGYSLGNDLNASGNRYYNPAPTRNYYIGLQVTWL